MNKNIKLLALINCIIVFIFYAHTINYSWRFYDEDIIYNESLFPIPQSFSEIFEIIGSFGISQHFIASNPFYSDISNLRCDRINNLTILFVYFLFKKNAALYHLLSLLIHLTNTFILFLLLNKISSIYTKHSKINLILMSALTLLWSLHPVNVEPVLFTTNWPTLLSYTLCFVALFLLLDFNGKKPILLSFTTFFIFLVSLFICEHGVTFPIILFFYYLVTYHHKNLNSTYLKSLAASFNKILPLLFSLLIFISYFLMSPTKSNMFKITEISVLTNLQRIFWLSPQVFLHFIKLILFPKNLSIDQTAYVKLGYDLYAPHAMLCIFLFFSLIILSMISLLFTRKKIFFCFFISFVPFFIALSPFLHLLSPIYNIASERYLYFPLFFLTVGISHLFFSITSKSSKLELIVIPLLILIVSTYSIRTYIRTLDWKDSKTLLTSAIKTAPNNLLKGLRQEMLASYLKSVNDPQSQTYSKRALASLGKALKEFQLEKTKYKNNIPQIIKFYGFDPKTLIAKTKFLIAFTDYYINGNPQIAYEIFSPYVDYFNPIDSQILIFYYKILFNIKKIDAAEKLLNKALLQNQISPSLYVALSDLYEYKYNDLTKTEKYLKESLKLFPYDPPTLFGLKRLYKILNNAEQFAHYSYLLGLRTHDIKSLQEAAYVYARLNIKNKSRTIIKKLLTTYPTDNETINIKTLYEQRYGRL